MCGAIVLFSLFCCVIQIGGYDLRVVNDNWFYLLFVCMLLLESFSYDIGIY